MIGNRKLKGGQEESISFFSFKILDIFVINMKFDLRDPIQKNIFIRSMSLIIAMIAFLFLWRINDLIHFVGSVVSLLTPFLLGFGLAFLLDGPVNWTMNRLMEFNLSPKLSRSLAIAIVTIFFVLFILFTFWVLIPSLIDSITVFVNNFSGYVSQLENILTHLAERYNIDISALLSSFESMNISDTFQKMVQSSMTKMMSYSIDIIHFATNAIISLAAAVYMIADKEHLLRTFKVLVYMIFGQNKGNFIQIYSMDAKNVFQQYIVGNLTDSFIIGLITWFGCIVLKLPYAPMIGLIIGITNIIPVFGPFLGAIPVIILLVLIKPMYAVIFAVFILIIQQMDGNVIKPLILGDKLGISGFWILFSVSIGGALFGAVGMFLGVPVFVLIYEALKDIAEISLKERHLVIPDSSSVVIEQKVKNETK